LHRLRDRVFRSVVLALEHIVTSPDDDGLTLVDVLADRTAVEPSEELETRELLGYLRDAVGLLPERHRIVVVGYFLEGRTSLELAELLDVTESRISQLRSESLEMLKEGIEAQYTTTVEPPPRGRAARRRVDYANAIGDATDWRNRIVAPAPV
jgi:RNA polymerase sigma factor for flagellar operon FliA